MTIVPLTADLAYLTAEIPGIGGKIKERAEDFLVEELPLYAPCGEGEHLYLYVQKQGTATTDVIRRLAKVCNVRQGDVGYAGLKDKHAITRQHFSVRLPDPSQDAALLPQVEYANLKVLWAQRHTNKLRRGHLAGNRFVIYLRQVDPAAVVRARQLVQLLEQRGVPNFLGEQRFGYKQDNHELGRLLLRGQWDELLAQLLGRPTEPDSTRAGREAFERGDYAGALAAWPRYLRHERRALDLLRQGRSAREAVLGLDEYQRQFLISSLQSAMFNRVLDRRLRDGEFDRLLLGDLAYKHDSSAVFLVDAAAAEEDNRPGGRVEKREVSPSGPMCGAKMAQPTGAAAEAEARVLRDFDLSVADFVNAKHAPSDGSRRPLRTFITNPDVSAGGDQYGPYIRLAFDLPRGSFATIVLREIMKPKQTGAQIAEEMEDSSQGAEGDRSQGR
jgi:tRNA pseudouridine13 synthase